jgi:hypothetical protein
VGAALQPLPHRVGRRPGLKQIHLSFEARIGISRGSFLRKGGYPPRGPLRRV